MKKLIYTLGTISFAVSAVLWFFFPDTYLALFPPLVAVAVIQIQQWRKMVRELTFAERTLFANMVEYTPQAVVVILAGALLWYADVPYRVVGLILVAHAYIFLVLPSYSVSTKEAKKKVGTLFTDEAVKKRLSKQILNVSIMAVTFGIITWIFIRTHNPIPAAVSASLGIAVVFLYRHDKKIFIR